MPYFRKELILPPLVYWEDEGDPKKVTFHDPESTASPEKQYAQEIARVVDKICEDPLHNGWAYSMLEGMKTAILSTNTLIMAARVEFISGLQAILESYKGKFDAYKN